MKIVLITTCIALAAASASAESLRKYSGSESPREAPAVSAAPQNAPSRPNLLLERQQAALAAMRGLPTETRKKWMETFAAREKAAVNERNYEAAAYYRGIIEAEQGRAK